MIIIIIKINNLKIKTVVKKGDVLLKLEAMKMENVVTAPIGGVIKEFNIKKGQPVNKGDILVEIG